MCVYIYIDTYIHTTILIIYLFTCIFIEKFKLLFKIYVFYIKIFVPVLII